KAVHDLHGSAHFASKSEILDMGLLGNSVLNNLHESNGNGVYVGSWKDKKNTHLLVHEGPEPVLAYAPTRSGKGVGLVIPTLLSWKHSVVVLDIKGENYELTAGWRKRYANNVIYKFDPSSNDENRTKFNPLDEIRLETDYQFADTQNIVLMIINPDGKGLKDHWDRTSQSFLVGVILHCKYIALSKGKAATFSDVVTLLSDPKRSIDKVIEEMMTFEHHAEEKRVDPEIAASARDMLNKSDKERSGVLSSAVSYLTIFRDPIVSKNMLSSDFKIRDLMNGKKPVSLYLVTPPGDQVRLMPIIRLIMNQIIKILTEDMVYKHRLLLMLDEFPSLGKMEEFERALAFISGYGIKAYIITQDLNQIHASYGHHESITSNCSVQIAYAPNKNETAELLSKNLGSSTIVKKSFSSSGNKYSSLLHRTETIQEVKRPLLTPDECKRLPGIRKDKQGHIIDTGDMLIFVSGHAPIYGKKIMYFLNPIFKARSEVRLS
ncbi:MAG: type IV secretory system conjugative DNA transfer family protein, partial [Candidatus Margulisbacteria bacterium]|nr:type IV secretory system conjugative DNA transfer family protein [Candidatus Margulisiibacteriota bacterium]